MIKELELELAKSDKGINTIAGGGWHANSGSFRNQLPGCVIGTGVDDSGQCSIE